MNKSEPLPPGSCAVSYVASETNALAIGKLLDGILVKAFDEMRAYARQNRVNISKISFELEADGLALSFTQSPRIPEPIITLHYQGGTETR